MDGLVSRLQLALVEPSPLQGGGSKAGWPRANETGPGNDRE